MRFPSSNRKSRRAPRTGERVYLAPFDDLAGATGTVTGPADEHDQYPVRLDNGDTIHRSAICLYPI